MLSTKEILYAVYHENKLKFDKDLFQKIHKLIEYRNKVAIHPDKRFKEESLEYLFDSDFESLLQQFIFEIKVKHSYKK